MAAILQMIFSGAFSWKFCILIEISLKFVSKGPIDNNPALVKKMAWHQIGDKLLSEPILTKIIWRIYAALWGDEFNFYANMIQNMDSNIDKFLLDTNPYFVNLKLYKRERVVLLKSSWWSVTKYGPVKPYGINILQLNWFSLWLLVCLTPSH